ncbi:MAG: hypothetical protein P8Z76_19555 [Alphaproteobacteria bacterium]
MKYRIEGFDKQYPDGLVRETDSAVDALAAFHEVVDACGDAQVFCGERSMMLSKLRDLADQEKQAARN